MTEFATETLPHLVADLSAVAYALVFLGGVLTSIGPCNMAMVPVIMAYVGGCANPTRAKGLYLSTFFTLGSAVTFMALGLIAAAIGGLFGTEKKILFWLAAGVCLAIGLSLLGAFNLNFAFVTRLQPKRTAMTGLGGAFLLGLVVGLAGSQCGTPVLVAILGIVMATGKVAYGASLLFAYALGRGVPIILAGTFTGVIKALPAMERCTRWMEKSAGVVLIAVGLYFLWIA